MITNIMYTFIVVGVLLAVGSIPELVAGQNCACSAEQCCSQYGYCGSGYDYCGAGCREGPCLKTPAPNNVSVPEIVTYAFFDAISDQADVSCAGKDFFTRAAFVEALYSYPLFGRAGSADDSKREVAAFFAHVAHATGHFCNIEDMNGPMRDYCDNNNTQYPCTPNKGYYGRGAIHLSWNYNYGPAGNSIGFDGLNNPDIVAKDPVISFKTALWFWMNRVQPIMTSGHGFGATIRAINGKLECGGTNPDNVNSRIGYYTEYCNLLGVDAGNDLRC